ncbi:MAG: EFR1 family ferrodoxin [Planctomycetota bacterium]|jgi:ferredoxin|nr:EFR1 family ferrodoxin [Planctomycetota bacterium]
MVGNKIILAVFTGTGNTLAAAEQLARSLTAAGKSVRLLPMEKPESLAAGFDKDAALGLAAPVACFATYPTVWRFIDTLPDGEGRGVFFFATMGGMGAGMQGPVGRALARKGYRLIAAAAIAVCGNYGAGAPTDDRRETVHAAMRNKIDAFAKRLLAGRGGWSRGWFNPLSTLFYWLGRKRISFRAFRRFFPATVDKSLCTGCALCAGLCPEKAIVMKDGKAEIGDACQSCQRCVGFCQVGAVGVSGKPVRQYRAVSLDALQSFLNGAASGDA